MTVMMRAVKSWVGKEGVVSPGNQFMADDARAALLEAEGRAFRVEAEDVEKTAPAESRQRKRGPGRPRKNKADE